MTRVIQPNSAKYTGTRKWFVCISQHPKQGRLGRKPSEPQLNRVDYLLYTLARTTKALSAAIPMIQPPFSRAAPWLFHSLQRLLQSITKQVSESYASSSTFDSGFCRQAQKRAFLGLVTTVIVDLDQSSADLRGVSLTSGIPELLLGELLLSRAPHVAAPNTCREINPQSTKSGTNTFSPRSKRYNSI